MKILFAAPVTFDRITIFVSQYVTGLARAATQLGHENKIIQTSENIYVNKSWKSFEKAYLIFRRRFKKIIDIPHDLKLGFRLLKEVEEYKPDILFIHLVDNSHTHFIINRIRQTGTRVITWLGVHPSQVSPGIRKLLQSSDHVLIYDQAYLEYYNQHIRADNIHILPLGCDVAYHDSTHPSELFVKQHGVDVCFIGLFDKHREKYLNELTDFDLGIWSWNIDDYKTPLKKFHKGHAYGKELIKVLKSSKIVLNIHRDFEVGGGNFRLFEIPGSRAFQLVDNKQDIGTYFEIGKEIVTFDDARDLKEKVEYYLQNPKEREQIAEAGYRRVKKDHSLIDRMNKIIEITKRRI